MRAGGVEDGSRRGGQPPVPPKHLSQEKPGAGSGCDPCSESFPLVTHLSIDYLGPMTFAKTLNLALLVLFPVAWVAPLLHAGINLPLFGTKAVSVVSGLQALWETDIFLALLVTFFAIFAPMMKVIGVALIQFGMMRRKVLPVLAFLGKLAMADIFLIALYIVVVKGVHLAKVETGWGLYLFTFCVLASIFASQATAKKVVA